MTTRYVGNGLIGVQPRLWQAGVLHFQGETVRSQLDFELYTRVAATGTDTVDPADEITKYVAASYRRITALPDAGREVFISSTAAGTQRAFLGSTRGFLPVTSLGARTLLLSAIGRGTLDFLGFQNTSSIDMSMRVEILVDGRAVFDATPSIVSVGRFFTPLGQCAPGDPGSGAIVAACSALGTGGLQFRRSLAVYYTPTVNNITGANQVLYGYILNGER